MFVLASQQKENLGAMRSHGGTWQGGGRAAEGGWGMGRRAKMGAGKPIRTGGRAVSAGTSIRGGWGNSSTKDNNKHGKSALETVLSTLLGRNMSRTVVECLRYLCTGEPRKRHLKSGQTPSFRSGSSLVKQPRPLPPLMPSLPLPNLISTNGTNNNNNRAVVVLSFVKGRRGECQGHRHLQELAAVVAAVAPPMLHRGRLLCSLESAQAAGMGDRSLWLPFLHCENTEGRPPSLPQGALGEHGTVLQGYFEEFSRISFNEMKIVENRLLNKSEENYQADIHPTKTVESFFDRVIGDVQMNATGISKETFPTKGDRYNSAGQLSTVTVDNHSAPPNSGDSTSNDQSILLPRSASAENFFPEHTDNYISFYPKRKSKQLRKPTKLKTGNTDTKQTTGVPKIPTGSDKSKRTDTIYNSILESQERVNVSANNISSNDRKSDETDNSSNTETNEVSVQTESCQHSLFSNSRLDQALKPLYKPDIIGNSGIIRPSNLDMSASATLGGISYTDEDNSPTLVRFSNTCQLVIGYKSIDGVPDMQLMDTWLKWSGTWDAFTMMKEEMLEVQSMVMYTRMGRTSRHGFSYIVIMDVLTPTTHSMQLLRAVSQRLRVERWKGYSCVYSPVHLLPSDSTSANTPYNKDITTPHNVLSSYQTISNSRATGTLSKTSEIDSKGHTIKYRNTPSCSNSNASHSRSSAGASSTSENKERRRPHSLSDTSKVDNRMMKLSDRKQNINHNNIIESLSLNDIKSNINYSKGEALLLFGQPESCDCSFDDGINEPASSRLISKQGGV